MISNLRQRLIFYKQCSLLVPGYVKWNGMSWSRFPNFILKELLHCLKSNSINRSENTSKKWCKRYQYYRKRFPFTIRNNKWLIKHLLKYCLKKIRHCPKIEVNFIVFYDTKNFFFYYNVKDNFPHDQRNKIIYTITCPG